MSDTTDAGAPAGSDQQDAPVVPEGYVPAAEVETAREDARRRYQGENDKLKAEVARLQAAAPAPAADDSQSGSGEGFDPAAFRRQMLSDVSGVISMTQAAASVQSEFPHADPGLFTPEKLADFASPDSLRFAAKDSHDRVAAILGAETKGIEEKLRAEMEAKYGGSAGGEGAAGGTPPAGGDPTPEQISRMNPAEFMAYQDAHPGVIERVLAKAESGS